MTRTTAWIVGVVLALVALGATRAEAQPSWDNRGWAMLGERTVNGRYDRDRIDVGAYAGRYTKLTVVVEDSDLEMIDMRIRFADNTEYHPKVSQFFRQGSRTRVIDMPPGESTIRSIEFQYKNTPGDRRDARVQVWGWGTTPAAPPPPPPPPARYQWDTTGWQLLGEQSVDGLRRMDRDRITVGAYEGRFTKLQLVVDDSDMELFDFRVEFADRTEFHPRVQHFFKDGARSRVIDLPPSEQVIRYLDFKYRNLPGDRARARVQVWGFRAAPPRYQWDTRGWQLLGEQTVDGMRRLDRDRITVGGYEGRFSKLQLVVDDSDMELVDFRIEFADRTEFHPRVQQFFKDGARTRVIDLPPSEQVIRYIDFKYRNLPGDRARARVQVWGYRIAQNGNGGVVPPGRPGQVWDDRGWTMLGERVVDGHRRADRDTIAVGRAEGKFSKITVVVLDADMEMIEMVVHFRHDDFRPEVSQFFRGNTRTRVIDLPGDRERTIQSIDFMYKNLPGEGRARVQVWAK